VFLQKVAFEYKKKGVFSLLYTEVKETNENKDLNIVVCPRQCGSDGAEESGMGGVGS
jgi:acyl-CoA synthetase (NDP forming)